MTVVEAQVREITDLKLRIRELEAALEEANEYGGRQLTEATQYLVRAEKAEKERDELQAYIDTFGWNSDAKERIAETKRLEARVAELEKKLRIADDELAGYSEPREREED